MGKGYKLTSTAGDGPKVCAFFFSDKGCRNGANCKFSHVQPTAPTTCTPAPSSAKKSSAPPSDYSSSVVSSESESDGEIVETKAGAYASMAAAVNPFLSAVAPPAVVTAPVVAPPAMISAPVVTQPQQDPQTTSEKKKRKKRKKSITPAEEGSGNIFDLGKAETQTPASSQTSTPQTKKTKQDVATPQNKQHPTKANTAPPVASFRNLQLPIASFSLPTTPAAAAVKSPTPRPPSPQHEAAPTPPPKPLPVATAAHLKWKNAVIATQTHANYANAFNYDRAQQAEYSDGISTPKDWITSRPYGAWCASNPSAIAIDCEMCETKDPVSGKVDNKALCRISVVNANNPAEVLLDTLVKPGWPVSNHRTWVNGISASELENVQFTLKHAQTFMAALCSEQTVVVGHAVHNDLLALRMVHHCNADTAMLFAHTDATEGTVSLKNLAHGVCKKEMPEVHDSVNDARVALQCAQHYVDNDGKVATIEKVYSRSSSRSRMDAADTAMLLVHRLPPATQSTHISEMFLAYTCIKPKSVPEITFSGTHGKCNIEFMTREHAELAYHSLVGEEREDKTGKKQKRVGLKGGGYVCVRKMKKTK